MAAPMTAGGFAPYVDTARKVRFDRHPCRAGGHEHRRTRSADENLNLQIEAQPHVTQPLLGFQLTVQGDDPRSLSNRDVDQRRDAFLCSLHASPL
jgi:hypothetical protein